MQKCMPWFILGQKPQYGMNTKETKLCYEIARLSKTNGLCLIRGAKESHPKIMERQEKIEKLTDELICLGLDQYEE